MKIKKTTVSHERYEKGNPIIQVGANGSWIVNTERVNIALPTLSERCGGNYTEGTLAAL